jgi:hypothetical protein
MKKTIPLKVPFIENSLRKLRYSRRDQGENCDPENTLEEVYGMRKRITSVLLFTFLSSMLLNISYAETGWYIQTVDGSAEQVGSFCSLALDSNGNAHISYYDLTNSDLKYAKWIGSIWSISTVDETGDVGPYSSLALNENGVPSISYYDASNGDLKYAKWTGSSWSCQTVDATGNVGLHSSLALDPNGNPSISYYDASNGDLKYAKWTGSSWSCQTVDATGNVGRYCSLAIDSSGNPKVSYYDVTNGDLRYAKWVVSSWTMTAVDQGGDVGPYSCLALNSSGNPSISYYDASNGDLKYAALNSSSWIIKIVDQIGNVGPCSSLALDSSDNPRISYYDVTDGDLKYAWYYSGVGWVTETVDSIGEALGYSSLALDSNGNPRISYYEYVDSNLKYASGQKSPPPTKVAAPMFSPSGGTYTSPKSVVISCETEGANVRFTVDGSEPSSSSAIYSSPIFVEVTTTVKAKAFKSGMTESDTATAIYAIDLHDDKVSTPTFSPAGGTYSTAQSVVLSCATNDAIIHYSVDGSEPTSSSTMYSGPVLVNTGTITVKAKAFKTGMVDSDTASATYTIRVESAKVAAPTFSPPGGTYSSTQNVALNCGTEGAIIRFTVDGSEPTSLSTIYSSLISMGSTTIIKAKAFKDEMRARG